MAVMTLGNMRRNGARSMWIECACGHEVSFNVDALPDELEVPRVRELFRCSKCGSRPRQSRPDWRGHAKMGLRD